MEDLQAKLSSTQLQLGAVQRNYDALSGAHLLICISCACPANLVPMSSMPTLQAFWGPNSMRFSRSASAALLFTDASNGCNASVQPLTNAAHGRAVWGAGQLS